METAYFRVSLGYQSILKLSSKIQNTKDHMGKNSDFKLAIHFCTVVK